MSKKQAAMKKQEPQLNRTRPAAVPYDKFVQLWKASSSVSEVASSLGIKSNSCSAIANRLRRKGVKLKKFPRRSSQPIDVDKLNKIGSVK